MHSPQNTPSQPRRIASIAAAAALLAIIGSTAIAQSQSPAAQTALAIAGPASMTVAPSDATPTTAPLAAPSSASGREMLPEDRRQFMMLLILRQTARNPIGSLR